MPRKYKPSSRQLIVEPGDVQPGMDSKGRFKPGNRFTPLDKVRAPRLTMDMDAALKSIEQHFPAEGIGKMMSDVYALAFKTNSAKSALAVLELALAYRYGTPVNRQVNITGTLDQFRELFQDGPIYVDENGERIVNEDGSEVVEGQLKVMDGRQRKRRAEREMEADDAEIVGEVVEGVGRIVEET